MLPFLAPFRVRAIREALTRVPADDQELLRYFPVALAATIEAFVRKAVQEILDGRVDRFEAFLRTPFAKDTKFSLGVLGAVGGKRISAGDLVGHLIAVNGIPDIEQVMSDALGQPFHDLLRTVHDRRAVEIE